MSIPADVPHFRPAGSSPQLRVTFGAGLGRPSPVIGFATLAPCANKVFVRFPVWSETVRRKMAPAPIVISSSRGVVMAPPRECEQDESGRQRSSTGGVTLDAGLVPFRTQRCIRRPL